jgi:OOP family OmpA-OmpF porin
VVRTFAATPFVVRRSALSKARAQAVIDALVTGYKIDGKRLSASGVANYAPLASNVNENGRARNRRVEMVLQ